MPPPPPATATATARLRLRIEGAVQGVGFRPFVYRLATEAGLAGRVANQPDGVVIEVEGAPDALEAFRQRLERDVPAPALIQHVDASWRLPRGDDSFQIEPSAPGGFKTTLIQPDIAMCPDCLRELRDPGDRRYRYPFINCAHCGPRFSIIEAIPYDRPNTTMRRFTMCTRCRNEYEDPLDRRHHAQPIACPDCGPQLAYWDAAGTTLAAREEALQAAVKALRDGQIVALKGLGGFQLLVDARDAAAVRRLRARKHRSEKPFAVMFPSAEAAASICRISRLEMKLLRSAQAPIVLVERRSDALPPELAPGNPNLGALLPYTPLHHLLLDELGFPVVATSGNLSDEPIGIDEHEALERLGGIADGFLVHDRPIARPVDDSVTRVMLDREMVLRRARGYAPLPVTVKDPLPSVLALGAHLKNTVALSVGRHVFLGQHIGDLETARAHEAFRQSAADLPRLYDALPEVLACDAHPDYLSTQYAREAPTPRVEVQHHYAHVLACMAENDVDAPVLGIAWDGTGYGHDGVIWGGEFLRITARGYERVCHLRPFRLPGGDAAAREPRRCALGVRHALYGAAAFTEDDPQPRRRMLENGVHSPWTTSAGRLFDAAASLLDLRQTSAFEGQAAMALEFAAADGITEAYPIEVRDVVDWGPTVEAMLADPATVAERAAKFHNSLVEAMVMVARRVGHPVLALTGGCFQNRYLAERAVSRLRAEHFQPIWHRRVPPNDGGLALGQIIAAAREYPEANATQ